MRRTSVFLPEALFTELRRRAKVHGTTVSEEIRRSLEKEVEQENPNQGLLELADRFETVDWGPGPDIKSAEFREYIARRVEEKLGHRQDQ